MNQLILMAIMVGAALLGAAGQIFLKKVSETLQASIPALLTNKFIYLFVISYGAAVIIQTIVYRLGGDVSIIYPVISLSYVFAAILAWKFLGETISTWTIAGLMAIMCGISLIGIGAANGGVA